MSKGKLTTKQKLFVEFYLGEAKGNATEAARMAGYSGSSNTLSQTGAKLVRNGKISAHISQRVTEAAMPANEVLQRLSEHARASLEDFLDLEHFFIHDDLRKAKKNGKLHLLKKIAFNDYGGVKSFELHDPQAALVHLGKHHRLFDRAGEETPEMIEAAKDAVAQFLKENPTADPKEVVPIYAKSFGVSADDLISEAVN